MTILGQTPYIHRGLEIDPKQVWGSELNNALTRMISIVPGYGYLPPGTIMAKISESTNRAGLYVPYSVQAPTAGLAFLAGAYLTQDGAADAYAHVNMDDSYMFAVGDHLLAVDSDGSPVDLGAVSAIDQSTYSHKAVITVANDVTTGITVAKGGMVAIQTDASSPFSTAVGLLGYGVDTGYGEDAKGGDGVIVLSNAIAKKGLIYNYDSGALADLTYASEFGLELIIR